MAIGGASGYLTVNPTQDYVGQATRDAGDTFARVRAEKIANERTRLEADQNAQEQRRRDFKDSEEFRSKYSYISMGNSVDATNKQNLINFQEAYKKAQDDYFKTGDKKHLAIADNAMMGINSVLEAPKAMALKVEEMQKNKDAYNPTSFDKVAKLVSRMGKDLQSRIDENGTTVYDLVKRDDDGNVIGIEQKGISGKQLTDMLEVVPQYDITSDKGLLAQFKKRIATPIETEEEKDGKIIKTKSSPNAESVAKTMAKEISKDRSAVYSALENLGLDPEDKSNYSNEKVLEQVEASYVKTLLESAPKSESVVTDWKKKNYDADQAQRNISNANEAKRIKLSEQPTTTEKKTPLTNRFTGQIEKDKDGNPIMVTSISTTTKGGGEKPKAPTKAELKAKADALRKKYAPKK